MRKVFDSVSMGAVADLSLVVDKLDANIATYHDARHAVRVWERQPSCALLCLYLLACRIGPVHLSGQNVSATAGELLAIRPMYIVCTVAHTASPNVSGGLVEVAFHCFDLGHTTPCAFSIRTCLVKLPKCSTMHCVTCQIALV